MYYIKLIMNCYRLETEKDHRDDRKLTDEPNDIWEPLYYVCSYVVS